MRRVLYWTFRKVPVMRIPYLGRRMALLARRRDLTPELAAKILDALDRAADFYAKVTGREPPPVRVHKGRITIAEVQGTCGAACAYLGQTGIEIMPAYLDVMVRAVRERGEFDQPLFYELGRNWWFWTRTLDVSPGSVCTGYAVFMRFLAMEAACVKGAPYQGWPFEEFRAACLSLLDVYLANPEAPSWEMLLSTSPVAVHTFVREGRNSITLSTADLLASLFDRLCQRHGGIDFFARFLKAAENLPESKTAADICANLVAAASSAAGRDLGDEFRAWKFSLTPSAAR